VGGGGGPASFCSTVGRLSPSRAARGAWGRALQRRRRWRPAEPWEAGANLARLQPPVGSRSTQSTSERGRLELPPGLHEGLGLVQEPLVELGRRGDAALRAAVCLSCWSSAGKKLRSVMTEGLRDPAASQILAVEACTYHDNTGEARLQNVRQQPGRIAGPEEYLRWSSSVGKREEVMITPEEYSPERDDALLGMMACLTAPTWAPNSPSRAAPRGADRRLTSATLGAGHAASLARMKRGKVNQKSCSRCSTESAGRTAGARGVRGARTAQRLSFLGERGRVKRLVKRLHGTFCVFSSAFFPLWGLLDEDIAPDRCAQHTPAILCLRSNPSSGVATPWNPPVEPANRACAELGELWARRQ
jgi:hypothetical protein